jgi:transposase-like protein
MKTSVKDAKARLWQVRFQQFEADGRSVVEFCDSVGCSPNTFYYWKKKLGSPIDMMRGRSLDASSHRESSRS